ncbi:hypothetical protein WICMUC_005143 [Wickerhamomyces mucosus]|uniref:Uncharacterized protein n=1 Tax=Wickerhamomyces mucosus TaxID=1378264 RepID=A0A9P8PAE0_9ASCO|nr:hypothetical protein WICMUC_005143 [Wickerhamomyces mucosus]
MLANIPLHQITVAKYRCSKLQNTAAASITSPVTIDIAISAAPYDTTQSTTASIEKKTSRVWCNRYTLLQRYTLEFLSNYFPELLFTQLDIGDQAP